MERQKFRRIEKNDIMKTLLFAFLALIGVTMFAPQAQARDRHHSRHHHHHHYDSGRSYYRSYPRYYTSYPRYYTPYRSYYYSSYPGYYYPRSHYYHRRPGVVLSFGF